ncbi:carbohydrate-selective porin, OprB family [Coleofasciculus chthonoplastes PCC 7420]|uniref:Carbohydrate-selective porin, OprB family n=1 Tax=Coleofasciculus chthonoplastes PCC 7420 TaxID=118168 RepID=B4VVY7_9CYAN|nr:iron uptake porin [Coleofasciculus chthonoplastes]EDX73985.1 carbohydrate-selective porin, OprB family [Coleofasciculus chthonoplastes PCC 7420]
MTTYGRLGKTASSALMFATLGCWVTSFSAAQATPVESSEQQPTDLARLTETSGVDPGLFLSTETGLVNSPVEIATPVTEAEIITELEVSTTSEVGMITSTDSLIESEDTFVETQVQDLAQALPEMEDSSDPTVSEPLFVDPLEAVEESDPMDQVTNVSQLRDVSPGDWAYEALRSLVERYGCIAGYPDGTFRGNRAMTRYEFAAGVNACMQQIERLIAGRTEFPTGDLESLRRLVLEFEAELATLGARVDNLEGRTALLEDNQFSTTTKIFGQAILGVQGRTENDFEFGTGTFEDEDTNVNVINNVQLSLFTQLSPRSLLLTSFQAGDGSGTGNSLRNYISLGYEGDTNNDLRLTDLNYRQLFGSNFAVIVGPEGVNPVNVFRGVNRIESAGSGSLSRFAQRNPIINIGNGSGGIGFDWQIATRLSLQGVYSASDSDDPDDGLFGGDNGNTVAGVQLVASPTDTLDLSLQYINAYTPSGLLGTGVGDDQVIRGRFVLDGSDVLLRGPMNTNAFGSGLEWRVTPKFTLGGWLGYTDSNYKAGSGDVQTFNWMAFLNLPDLFGEGNLAGLYVGQPPKITDSDLPITLNVPDFVSNGGVGDEGDQPGTTTHVELFYRWQVADNISITPGVIVIFDPGHNPDNDTIGIGAIRTTFTF